MEFEIQKPEDKEKISYFYGDNSSSEDIAEHIEWNALLLIIHAECSIRYYEMSYRGGWWWMRAGPAGAPNVRPPRAARVRASERPIKNTTRWKRVDPFIRSEVRESIAPLLDYLTALKARYWPPNVIYIDFEFNESFSNALFGRDQVANQL